MSKKIPHPTGHVEWLVADQKPLREWWRWHFAGLAMQALIPITENFAWCEDAFSAVCAADNLIEELLKEKEDS